MQTEGKARRAAVRKFIRRERRKLGAVIRAALADADVKHARVAEELGVRPNVISEIVTGRRRTELSEIMIIAKVLRTDPMALVRRYMTW